MTEPSDNDTEQPEDSPSEAGDDEDWGYEEPPEPEGFGGRLAAPVVRLVEGYRGVKDNFLLGVTRVMPGGHKYWQRKMEKGLHGMYRSTGADAVAFAGLRNGRIQAEPVRWMEKDGEPPKWHGYEGREWHPSVEGYEVNQFGGPKRATPAIVAVEEAPRTSNPLELNIAEAVAHEEYRPMFENVVLESTNVYLPSREAAMADGGTPAAAGEAGEIDTSDWYIDEQEPQIVDFENYEDTLVDLGLGRASEEFAGTAVSLRNYFEMMYEKVGSDQLHQAKRYGQQAEKENKDMKALMVKIMLIGGAVALGALAFVAIILLNMGAIRESTGLTVGVDFARLFLGG